jgi:hypothetical protein
MVVKHSHWRIFSMGLMGSLGGDELAILVEVCDCSDSGVEVGGGDKWSLYELHK